MVKTLLHWWQESKGATAIEYGLIAAGIALVISGAVFAFGDSLYTLFYSTLGAMLTGGS